jgi:hypothetical protein
MVFLTLSGSYVYRLMTTTIITTLKGSHLGSVMNQVVQSRRGCGECGCLRDESKIDSGKWKIERRGAI